MSRITYVIIVSIPFLVMVRVFLLYLISVNVVLTNLYCFHEITLEHEMSMPSLTAV
jgi:hypothetical protein